MISKVFYFYTYQKDSFMRKTKGSNSVTIKFQNQGNRIFQNHR